MNLPGQHLNKECANMKEMTVLNQYWRHEWNHIVYPPLRHPSYWNHIAFLSSDILLEPCCIRPLRHPSYWNHIVFLSLDILLEPPLLLESHLTPNSITLDHAILFVLVCSTSRRSYGLHDACV